MRRLVPLLATTALLLLSATPIGTQAANPSSGTLSFANPHLTWANSTPMNGAAPAFTRLSCQAPTVCDDFTMTLDRGTDAVSYVVMKLTPSSGNSMEIILYAPGCNNTPTDTCYSVLGDEVHLTGPANGQYIVRVACTQCVNATYTMDVTLTALAPPPNIPGPFDQSFGWKVNALPGQDANTSFGEPSIWANHNGKVIANTFGPTVWISDDSGKTFSNATVVDPYCGGESGDADAVVAEDDTFYADNLCTAGPTNLSFTSKDDGQTWNQGGMGLPSLAGAPDSDRQWYGPDPNNSGTIYFGYHDFAGPNIDVWKSTDYGQTFTQYSSVTLLGSNFADASQGNTTSRPMVDPTDSQRVVMIYAFNDAVSSATTLPTAQDFNLREFGMAESTDGGSNWSNYKIYDAGSTGGMTNTVAHEFPQATIDSAGNVYVLFSERIGDQTQTHIMLGVLPKGQQAFTKVVQVDQGGLGANVFPWAAAGDPGMIDITWYGSPATDNNDHNAQWSQMFAQTKNALSSNPTFVQSRMSGSQPMHSADICLAGTLCLVTMGNRNLADFQGVTLDPCGYALSVWTDDNSGGGTTMFARQTAGSTIRPSLCQPGAQASPSPSPVTSPSPTSHPTPSPSPTQKPLPNTALAWITDAAVGRTLGLGLLVGLGLAVATRRRRRRI